jgi:hypothetical protein
LVSTLAQEQVGDWLPASVVPPPVQGWQVSPFIQ